MLATYRNPKLIFWLLIGAVLLVGISRIPLVTREAPESQLIISEFVAANETGLTDEDGEATDWIEIYNRSATPINLSGWALTDDPATPQKWTFPDITLSAGEYLVVFASGKDRRNTAPGAPLHTNFRLNRDGEYLALYNVLDQYEVAVDSPQFPPQFRDIAYGLDDAQAAYSYLSQPTPGQPNQSAQSWAGLVTDVNFSVPRGFYDQPFALTLSTDTPGAVIRYTTNGSEPTETNGTIYQIPIEISHTMLVRAAAFKPNFLPSAVQTHSYIFLDEVLTQPVNPPGFPTTWGTHVREYPGFNVSNITGTPVTPDYEMDPEVVNDPRYRATIKESLLSIPTLSIVTDMQHFTDLYSNPRERGRAWERPASIELIHPNGDQPDTQVNTGLRIQGGWGRWEIMPKHSLRLFFRDEYGAARFEYPLFPNSPVQSFDTLILRAGSHRGYAGKMADDRDSYLHETTYTEDEWLRDSQIEISGVGAHGAFVHLYLNGLYWGLYNVTERTDTAFMADYYGGDESEWDVLNQHGPVNDSEDISAWMETELIKIAQLDDTDRYPAIQQFFDTAHFADYILMHWYTGMHDWPENNWYAARRRPDGQIRYFAWDAEITWLGGARIYLGQGNNDVKRLFTAFMQNSDFKMEFADRAYKLLFNDGPLTDANSQARWLRLTQTIEQAIIAESARWGDTRFEPPITQADWFNARDGVLAQMEGNGAKLIALLREAGYYPAFDPPEFNQHGGLVSPHFQLTMTATIGDIYYTTDGNDPRLLGTGKIAPSAQRFADPIAITATTIIKVRALQGNEWSALNQATFTVVPQDNKLRFTEIMYNPAEGEDFEFIELTNASQTAIDISGLSFEGIEFTFPPNTTLNAAESIAVVSNLEMFAGKYLNARVAGEFSGKLSDRGEKITLRNLRGDEIISVTYDDENGWPLVADGRGGSLVIISSDSNPNDPKSWQVSLDPDGSPGVFEEQAWRR